MHIMCVRGVYVTDPAHNIVFGGNCPALRGHFSDRRFPMFFFCPSFGAVAIMFERLSRVGFGVFRCFLSFFVVSFGMLKDCCFFQRFFNKRLKLRFSPERFRQKLGLCFFSLVL